MLTSYQYNRATYNHFYVVVNIFKKFMKKVRQENMLCLNRDLKKQVQIIDTSPSSMHSLCFMVFSRLDIRITFTIRIGRAVTKLTVIGYDYIAYWLFPGQAKAMLHIFPFGLSN